MSEATRTAAPPTVVLVHGAFADASSWSGVIRRLQAKGVQVTAPANPLRGLSTDSAYIAGVLEEQHHITSRLPAASNSTCLAPMSFRRG